MKKTLICDSGATKASWAIVENGSVAAVADTPGINAMQTPQDVIESIIFHNLSGAIPGLEDVTDIHFYGAGCIDEDSCKAVSAPLRKLCPHATIEAQSDLLGAARALCGHGEGIACILGTGANSCLFDGEKIVANVPPLGYILGDEGSGATLGRKLIADTLKRLMPYEIKRAFFDYCGLDYPAIIRRVYREPGANAFMASMVPFIKDNIGNQRMHRLVVDSFGEFFDRNVLQYRANVPVGFVGSVAYHFEPQLREAAEARRIKLGAIIKNPLLKLVEYHTRCI